jgi:hypothetical protein
LCLQIVNDHGWTGDDRLVAVTQAGRVLIIDECEVRQEFWSPMSRGGSVASIALGGGSASGGLTSGIARDASPQLQPASPPHVRGNVPATCVAVHAAGFVVGCASGLLMFYQRYESDFKDAGA